MSNVYCLQISSGCIQGHRSFGRKEHLIKITSELDNPRKESVSPSPTLYKTKRETIKDDIQ